MEIYTKPTMTGQTTDKQRNKIRETLQKMGHDEVLKNVLYLY